MAQIVGLTCSTETCARFLLFFETIEPFFSANDENVLGIECAVATPLIPTIIRTAWIIIEEELVEDDGDSGVAEALTKRADTLSLRFIRLPVAEEYFGHEETNFCAFVPFCG